MGHSVFQFFFGFVFSQYSLSARSYFAGLVVSIAFSFFRPYAIHCCIFLWNLGATLCSFNQWLAFFIRAQLREDVVPGAHDLAEKMW